MGGRIKKFGFPKGVRLRKTRDYRSCYEEGRRFYSENFVIFVRKRERDGLGIRAGIGVSKKIGKAVLRNRIKRLIREFMRLHRSMVQEDLDVVVVPKKGIDVKKFKLKDVKAELYPILKSLTKSFASER